MDATSADPPLPQTLARVSWVCPLIMVGMVIGLRSGPGNDPIVDMVARLLAVIGFVLGLVSLFGIRRYGSKKILAPALVGILLNAFFILVWLTVESI
jgi:hypothetical protein